MFPFCRFLPGWRGAALALWVVFCGQAAPALALDQVTLQLKWSHGFQFAGYYAARELGYYREAGLEVQIDEARPGDDPLAPVLEGKVQFGVGMSNLLLLRQSGKPVVVLAVIFQHSPLVFVTRQSSPTHGIHDLAGKRVMIEQHSDELFAYLKQEGIAPEQLEQLPHSFDPDDLIHGKVDAMSAYVINETFFLERAGIPYQVYTPRAAGIDFYGDNLFTTEQEIRQHPQRVEAFRAASLRGWRYAMEHPDEIADLIYDKYSPRQPRDFYRFEAQHMIPLLRTDLIEVGYMNPGRWRHIADTYADLGLLPRDFSLEGFLYQVKPRRDQSWLLPAVVIFGLGTLLVFYIVGINRRLAAALVSSRQNETTIRDSERKYRMLAENMADVVWVYDPQKERFTYVSPSSERLGGYSADEMLALALDDLLLPADCQIFKQRIASRVEALQLGRMAADNAFTSEVQQKRKDGSMVWVEVVVRYVLAPETGCVELHGVSREISERKRSEAHMRQMAQQDPLTGLANRALFQEMLNVALANARRDASRLSLLFIDLDKFKPVNDSLGHGVGDLLLQAVAQRILASVRESDSVARIGGDEFIVLLRNVDAATNALQVAEKIRQALDQPFAIDEHRLEISASIGVAMFPEHGGNGIELVKHADDAMYAAKNHGRDSVQIYGEGLAPDQRA